MFLSIEGLRASEYFRPDRLPYAWPGLSRTGMSYHLRVLEKQGFVRSFRDGLHRIYYLETGNSHFRKINLPGKNPRSPWNGLNWLERATSYLAVHPQTKRILLHLIATGQASAKEIAAEMGLQLSSVYHHLRRLRREGLLGGGRGRKYFPSESALLAVSSLRDLSTVELKAALLKQNEQGRYSLWLSKLISSQESAGL